MIKKRVFESSEMGPSETVYDALTSHDIDCRIKSYEQKYGMPLSRYRKQFSCDDALPWEGIDLMDWEVLVEERSRRARQS